MKRNPDRSEYDAELRHPKQVLYRMIGSKGFLWACGFLGLVFTALITLGAQTYIQKQASQSPDILAYKTDTDTLKTQIKVLAETASEHTFVLAQQTKAIDDEKAIQGKIFDALKGVSADIHQVDNHVSALGQAVSDQADAVKEIRAEQVKNR